MSTTDAMSPVHDAKNVVGRVRNLIVSNHLERGDRLPPIRELAVQFGVKPGTVRDALLTAQAQGLVKVLPRVGAIVQTSEESFTGQDESERIGANIAGVIGQGDQNLFHILETREALEIAMVARAAERRELTELFRLRQILADMVKIPLEVESPEFAKLDIDFHLEIARLSGNSVMASMLRMLLLEIKPHLDRIRWSDNRRDSANESHARIYSSLVVGDVAQAQSEMRDHIRSTYNSLLDEMRKPPAVNGDE